jgi:hypothetical protein
MHLIRLLNQNDPKNDVWRKLHYIRKVFNTLETFFPKLLELIWRVNEMPSRRNDLAKVTLG